MSIPRSIAAAIIVLMAMYISCLGQGQAGQNVRVQTFEKVWQTVNEKFWDPKFLGVDWRASHDRFAPMAAAARSDAELYHVIGKMLSELKVSHLKLILPDAIEQLKSKPVITGLGLKDIEGQIVVREIWKNSSAEEAGIRTGFVITKIGGESIKTAKEARTKLRGEANSRVAITYLDQKNVVREVSLERRKLPDSQLEKETFAGDASLYGVFISSRLSANIGYIHFTNFLTGIDQRLITAIASMKDRPGIIIDLRGNGGGDDDVGIALANAIFVKPTQLMITRTREGDDDYYRAKGNKDAYTGKIVILMDEDSGSASEQLAAGLQESGRAVVIGETSAGDDMDADIIKLPTGAYLIYPYGEPRTPKGYVVEEHGVVPNIKVKLTKKDLLAGSDSQLRAAINYILKH